MTDDAMWEFLGIELFRVGDTPVSTGSLVTLLVILGVTLIISWVMQRSMQRALRYRGVDAGTSAVIRRLLHYSLLLVGFGSAMQTIGIDLGALFAAGAIFAVGLGFAMQSIMQNFVSGVILLLERTIKPGDVLGVEGTMVKVADLGIRATLVHTRDAEALIVPNSVLIQSTVKNYTLRESSYRIRVPVGVTYGSDLERVFATLQRVGQSVDAHWGTADKPAQVVMTGFGDSSVNFELAVWTNDPWSQRQAVSDLHDAIWWAFKEADIVIAFPQLDVHFDSAGLQALEGVRPAGVRPQA